MSLINCICSLIGRIFQLGLCFGFLIAIFLVLLLGGGIALLVMMLS